MVVNVYNAPIGILAQSGRDSMVGLTINQSDPQLEEAFASLVRQGIDQSLRDIALEVYNTIEQLRKVSCQDDGRKKPLIAKCWQSLKRLVDIGKNIKEAITFAITVYGILQPLAVANGVPLPPLDPSLIALAGISMAVGNSGAQRSSMSDGR